VIPLYHDFTGETVLVFGGGTVGSRKASRFADEARVVVVSPGFDDRLVDLAEEDRESVELVRATPDAEAIHGWIDRVDPALVVAATDDAAVNAAAEAAALDTGALVNRTDVSAGDRSGGRDVRSVVVPATIEDDPVRVALSTGGASPGAREGAPRADRSGDRRRRRDGGAVRDAPCGAQRPRCPPRNVGKRSAASCDPRGLEGFTKGDSYGRQEADSVIEEVLNR